MLYAMKIKGEITGAIVYDGVEVPNRVGVEYVPLDITLEDKPTFEDGNFVPYEKSKRKEEDIKMLKGIMKDKKQDTIYKKQAEARLSYIQGEIGEEEYSNIVEEISKDG